MNLSRPLAIGLFATLGTSASGVLFAETTTSPKIIISNMVGQEIPLETGSTVEVLSNGDLSVRCRLDTLSNCTSIGTGDTSTGEPPSVTLTPSALSLTAGSAFSLNWTSTGDACYAADPSGVANWSGRALSSSGSQSLVLNEGAYTFSLRCYNATGSRTVQTAQVTVDAPVVAAGYCAEYYGPIFPVPTDPAFTAFGFTRNEVQFINIWGVEPGYSAAKKGVPGTFLDPAAGRYLAIPFSLATTDSSFTSQIRMSWVEAQAVGTSTGAITLTVSPCPGDFRKPISAPQDPYLGTSCRVTAANISGNLNIATIGSGLSGCQIPANKLLYINIAPYNMYGTSAPTTTTCPPGDSHCGVSLRHE